MPARITVGPNDHRRTYVVGEGQAQLPDVSLVSEEFIVTFVMASSGPFTISHTNRIIGHTGPSLEMNKLGHWVRLQPNRESQSWVALRGGAF